MTPIAILLDLAGLSQREAAEFLKCSPSSIDKMARGVRSAPAGIIDELRTLIDRQEEAADYFIDQLDELIAEHGAPETIELGFPADDHEAQTLGWPCVGAWSAMAARVIAQTDLPCVLVPRASTPATAAATDSHERALK
jgi:transcriptional regulator with XRE-family HTH domain